LMACFIFNQSISTFSVIDVPFLFSLFLYKVHMESVLNKHTLKLRGFFFPLYLLYNGYVLNL
jgi:hypothetical protein